MQHTGLLRSAVAIPLFFLLTTEAAPAAESFDDIKSVASAPSQPCSTSNGSRYCAVFFENEPPDFPTRLYTRLGDPRQSGPSFEQRF